MFERVIRSIKLIGPEGTIAAGEKYIGIAQRSSDAGLGAGGLGEEVAIWYEAIRVLAGAGENFTDSMADVRSEKGLLIFAEAARSCAQTQRCRFGFKRDKVDDSANRVRAVERSAGAMQYINGGNGLERNRNVKIEVRGFDVVYTQTVEQYQRLLERSSANGDVSLGSRRSTLLDVDGGVRTKVVLDILEGEAMFLRVEGDNGASRFPRCHGLRIAEHVDSGLESGESFGAGGVCGAGWDCWQSAGKVRDRTKDMASFFIGISYIFADQSNQEEVV